MMFPGQFKCDMTSYLRRGGVKGRDGGEFLAWRDTSLTRLSACYL